MRPETPGFLYDMRTAIDRMLQFVQGRTLEEYLEDLLLRSAVERQLEILGEAMAAIARTDPDTAHAIADARGIVGLRNIIIHRYGQVDSRLIWEIVQQNVAGLRTRIDVLLQDAPE